MIKEKLIGPYLAGGRWATIKLTKNGPWHGTLNTMVFFSQIHPLKLYLFIYVDAKNENLKLYYCTGNFQ